MSRTGNNVKNENCSKKYKNNVLFKILSFVYILITILFCGYVVMLNVLPTKYIILLIGIILFISLPMCIVLFSKRKKIVAKIICSLLIILILVCYGLVYKYLYKTFDFIATMSDDTISEEIEEYYILALNNSKYSSIDDIKNKNVYYFNIDSNVKDKLLSNVKLDLKDTNNLNVLSKNLLDEKFELIFVSSSQYSIILDDNEEFKNKTKIIYTLTQKVQNEQQESIKDENSKHTIQKGCFNIYISGIDTSGSINNVSRSDANIVATVNTKTHEILLTSIPRDYYVTLHSKKAKDKLTHSGIYGINETVTTVEDLLGVDINYYMRVNFTTVIKVVDVIGGIDVYSDFAFNGLGYNFVKGKNHLNGQQALAFSRERHSFASGDRQRGKNQQKVIDAIITKLTSSKTLLTQYSNILKSLSGSFQTNIDQNDISILIKEQLDSMAAWKITTISLDGTGKYTTTYSCGSQNLYVMIPNVETVDNAKEKINLLLNKN